MQHLEVRWNKNGLYLLCLLPIQMQPTVFCIGEMNTPMHIHQHGRDNSRISQVNGPPMRLEYHPVVFRWSHGGKQIKLAGSFNDWTEYIPLELDSDGYHQVQLDLPEGIHQYKLIVDGEWKCDNQAPILVEPLSGYKNNYVSVSSKHPFHQGFFS